MKNLTIRLEIEGEIGYAEKKMNIPDDYTLEVAIQDLADKESSLYGMIKHLTHHLVGTDYSLTCDQCKEIKKKLDRYNEVPEHNQDVPAV